MSTGRQDGLEIELASTEYSGSGFDSDFDYGLGFDPASPLLSLAT